MIEIKGMDQAIETLKELRISLANKELKAALRPALRIYVNAIKKQAPVSSRTVREFWGKRMKIQPGSLKKSVRAIIAKKSPAGELRVYVGPMSLSNKKRSKAENNTVGNDGWFRHFIIRGTAGYTIKKGKNKGKYMRGQAANPFVDRGIAGADGAAFARFEKTFAEMVKKKVG
jgi:hypothetical protein